MNPLDIEMIQKSIEGKEGKISFYYASLGDLRETHAINAGEEMEAAGTIRIPILLETLRQVEERQLKLAQRVVIEPHNRVKGARTEELGKEDYSLLELLRWMTLVKDGSATNQLIDLVGMDAINAYSRELGMENTVLRRKMEDEDARRQGEHNVSTAYDMGHAAAQIFLESMPHDVPTPLSSFVSRQALALMRECRDSLSMLRHIPWSVNCAHQGGLLEASEDQPLVVHDVGVVYATGGTYALSIFVEGASSVDAGKRIIGELGREVYQQALYTP